ncbi:AAA family ATPase [Pseudarthrobacter sp. J1738]|uniref:AAA family ATPase n=1 Tax=Pseudarthrobacter sp. J1738 TaxID=3420446 RepID=UPI003D2792C3
MRIHRLVINAFGPFAGEESVDFDALGEHGLFLLNGPTGSGKTSVLDAICYALYGSVPGVRQDGKRLRSDHAAPEAEPSVLCEFTAQGRRFEVLRSPQWAKPSTRSSRGFVTQNATSRLREFVDGRWEEKSTRNDEVGAEISAVLGMDREQFTRVVMLPQGDFAAFLRSKEEDRRVLLQKLFGTGVFEAVEKQLSQMATEAKEQINALEHGLRNVLLGAENAAAPLLEQLPSFPESEVPAIQAEDALDVDKAASRLEWLLAQGGAVASEQAQATSVAAETFVAHQNAVQEAVKTQERHLQLELAQVRKMAHDAEEALYIEQAKSLRVHRAAQTVVPVLDAHLAASQELSASLESETAAVEQLQELGLEQLGDVEQREVLTQTVDDLAVLRHGVTQEKRVDSLEATIRSFESEAQQAVTRIEEQRQEAALGKNTLTTLNEEIAELERSQESLDAAAQAVEAAREFISLIGEYSVAVVERESAAQAHNVAKGNTQSLRSQWFSLREQRLQNAAAELAATLEAGHECPVCGSSDHPHPASPSEGSGNLGELEKEAFAGYEAATSAESQADAVLAERKIAVAHLDGKGGSTELSVAQAQLAAAQERVARIKSASKKLSDAQENKTAVEAQLAAVDQKIEAAEQQRIAAEQQLAVASAELNQLNAELQELRAGASTLAERITVLERKRDVLQANADARARVVVATAALQESESKLQQALAKQHFESSEQVRVGLLSSADLTALEQSLRKYETEQAQLEQLFSSDALIQAQTELAAAEAPDSFTSDTLRAEVTHLNEVLETSTEQLRSLQRQADLSHSAVEQITKAAKVFADQSAANGPVWERAAMLSSLAQTSAGNGENSRRMSLNSYVLAARLERVAEEASTRLLTMSDGRYSLAHTDARAVRNQKSGLGLEVVDLWTGQSRETSTLSGGESFMASLALALGLADVVQQESGGVEIDTLFVDEGFGSLDEQALEQVMDALESLREGGRMVGLVSHVAEMKMRIPAQLQLMKGRQGSTLKFVDLSSLA